ncbi:Aste57867_13179 [Aphanomyces stellatus]|uniref:Aste57867_13179 protein n=1 Tax=Aphanomyces stellatus TaxID=120398 RepID=A0A485KXR4_9STRA|nr:hypothetical protein As57867_013130 [Aphanomyces stellatus]VFT90020.1 Aste57867_13179 [Aphanomyces stellatus]
MGIIDSSHLEPTASTLNPNPYGFPKYCVMYLVFMGLSLIASMFAARTLHRYNKLITSCVCFTMYLFFVCKSIYSLFRAVILIMMIDQFLAHKSSWLSLDDNHDVGAFRLIGYPSATNPKDQPPYSVKIPLFIGDTALISGTYWMLIMVVELLRLVKTTVDRGVVADMRHIRIYVCTNVSVIIVYIIASFVSFAPSQDVGFYTARFHTLLISSCSAHTIVIVAVTFAIVYLNWMGLKHESVECRVAHKPIYVRLKRIFAIYLGTMLPHVVLGWFLAADPDHTLEYMASIPDLLIATTNVLSSGSGALFAFVLVANQQCVLTWCQVSDGVIQQIQANEAPTDFPVFVNTDIESSSALWGHLGNVMHDAQDLHDNLLRELLVRHHGYEITTAGDAFQLAFHTIGDAVAYCLNVQEKLMVQPWPPAFVESHIPGSETILVPQSMLKRPKTLFHGVRVRMGIHASNSAEGDLVMAVHLVTHRVMYVGLSELIGREVSSIGHGGQIIVTAPVVRWLQSNILNNTPWAQAHPTVLQELGVYHIDDLKIDLGIAHIVPVSLNERVALFAPLDEGISTRSFVAANFTGSNNYELLISPRQSHID